jgi:hypothetical protein
VSRLAAVCCCNTDPATSPCLQWVQGCIPQFPVTVTVSFSGSYLLEQIDLCHPTVEIVTYRDYITYSGSFSVVYTSAFNALGGVDGGQAPPNPPTGSATVSWRKDTKFNRELPYPCGTWVACTVETLPSTMPISFGGVACQRDTVNGNAWFLESLFSGTGVYTINFLNDCCGDSAVCSSVYQYNTRLRVRGLFGAGCDAPLPPIEDSALCNCPTAGIEVTFLRESDAYPIIGPIRLQNATYVDPALSQRHTYTGTASVSFT